MKGAGMERGETKNDVNTVFCVKFSNNYKIKYKTNGNKINSCGRSLII